jgi:hypothetical protein
MLRNAPAYPPRLVRLALGEHLLGELGLPREQGVPAVDPTPALAELDLGTEAGADRARTASLIAAASDVAQAVATEAVVGDHRLADVVSWRPDPFRAGGDVAFWRDQWHGSGTVVPERDLQVPRHAIAGAVAEWLDVGREADPGRRSDRVAALAERVLRVLPDCREPGTRAAEPVRDDVAELADRFRKRLLLTAMPEA